MKTLFKYCLIFIFPIVVASICLEFKLRQVPNPYKYKYEWMQQNAEEVETLVLGSSLSFYGVRPEFLDGIAFNLANVSQRPEHDLFLLKYWGSRYKKLKTVIIPISYTFWFAGQLNGSESYRCRYYSIYMDYNGYPNTPKYSLELSDYRTARGKFDKILSPNGDLGYDEFGWGTSYQAAYKDLKKWDNKKVAEDIVNSHRVNHMDFVDYNLSLMRGIADFCKSKGMCLVMIQPPCWHSYYDKLNQDQLNKMYELTQMIQNEYHLPYFDYLKDKRFGSNDFYDINHLSDVGAAKFTKILNEDLRALDNTNPQ